MSLFNKKKVNLYDDEIVSVEEVTPEEDDISIEEIGSEPIEEKGEDEEVVRADMQTEDADEDKLDTIISLLKELLDVLKNDNQVKDISTTELSKAVSEQVTDDDNETEEVKEEEKVEESEGEDEEVSEDEIDKVIEGLEEDLGKDEGEEEESAPEEEEVKDSKVKDSYSVFAQGSRVKPAKSATTKTVTDAFQERYNIALKKSY